MMKKGRVAAVIAVALAVGLVSAALSLAGCGSPQSQNSQSTQQEQIQEESPKPLATSYAEWIEYYPDEYGSYAVDKVDETGKNHSHYYLRTLLETYEKPAPFLDASCIACKTTAFNDLYEEHGVEAFNMSWDDVKAEVEAYYDCELCHTDSQSLELSPSLVYFDMLARDAFAENDVKTMTCGQCHNNLALYRKLGSAETGFGHLDPYRYGTDAESIFKASVEDKAGSAVDEATGATIVRPTSENDLETYQGGIHQTMGATCVDCHMPATTNAEGDQYASHNASGSPLENEDALEYCLTCHKSQGIEGTTAMVEFARERQESSAAYQSQVEGKIATLKQLLTDATAAGAADGAALTEARDNYARASFYVQFYSGTLKNGAKSIHNPETYDKFMSRAEKLADDGIALMGNNS